MEATRVETQKREAAAAALERVESGMALGLGTGSTVAHFLTLLGRAMASGELTDVVGVPTSVRTGREARAAGIPLSGLGETPRLDLTVDGADEVSGELHLVKGMGGALLREKMVAQASDRLVVIADARKVVDRLGTVSPLPIEVVDWGWHVHAEFMRSRGAEVRVRSMEDGVPFKTDNGNLLLECSFPDGIDDPEELEAALGRRAGVVETGLFLGMAEEALIAGPGGVRSMRRSA